MSTSTENTSTSNATDNATESTNSTPAPAPAAHSSIKAEQKLSLLELFTKELKPIAGFTLETVRFRDVTDKKGNKSAGADLPAFAAYLPELSIKQLVADELDATTAPMAISVLLEAVAAERNNVLRSLILTTHAAGMKVAGTACDWAGVTLAQCLTNITTASANSRLTKEGIELWFNTAAMEAAAERAAELAAKKSIAPTADNYKQYCATIINNYLAKFMKAAATVPGWQLDEGDALMAMLGKIGTADPVAKALSDKIGTFLRVTRAKDEL